jgi:hypothetical protein
MNMEDDEPADASNVSNAKVSGKRYLLPSKDVYKTIDFGTGFTNQVFLNGKL